ncbi:hypothetical protein CDV31_009885 [Fusarium ambrosium]|uniref:Nephrocystin 3-like N-terminal domain-containing protein n=1 Tax=Fusarium ambrosium TaxID=131363 RepID=A0A428TS09_9HYPO|nr:hypothetical protein CDV31_009885 [Fusarium ambrosium]
MGSTSTPMPNGTSMGTVQNQVFGDQHVYGNQSFNSRPDAAQALIQDCLRSLAYPEMNDRPNTIGVSTGGTCEWLLRHKVWKSWKSSQRGLLWIKGKPGSGKSTLLRHAFHELKSTKAAKKALILSFFFHGRGNDLQRNQLGLFRSLLHQVLSEMPVELAELVTTFEQRWHVIGRPGVDWTWELDELRELFKRSILDILKNRPVWIFVDALDESGAENAKAVIRHFKDLLHGRSARSKLHICFACRHYPVQSWEGGFEICTEHENRQDILTYVRARLSDFQNPTTLALPDLITERSDGLFIWARLVVDRILDLELVDDPNGADQLIIKIIDTLPQNLNTLYAEIVRNTEQTSASLRLMQWISYARRPLSLDELRWAMVVDPDSPYTSLRHYKNTPDYTESNDVMERKVKTLSHGLVEIIHSSEKRVVQFIHQSVKDFFDNGAQESLGEASGDKPFQITEVTHYKLYRTCIHYLAMEEIAQLSNFHKMNPTRKHRLKEAVFSTYPLLSYVTSSWITHLARSQECPQQESHPFIWPPKTILERWIDNSYFVNECMSCPPHDVTLVHVLARYGLTVALRKFLSQGQWVDINARDDDDQSPLHYAADRGHTAIVQILLAFGADVDSQDYGGVAPLHLAACRGHVPIMKLLLAKGANADLEAVDGRTPLVWAVEGKQEAAIKMLLEEAVDVNYEYVSPLFMTPLTIRGIFNNMRLFGDDSPLIHTRSSIRWQLARDFYTVLDLDDYLLFWNPLTKLFGRSHDYSKIGLRRRHARPADRTPLLRAVELGFQSIVSMLLDKGASPELECRTGWSPLLLAKLRRNSSDQLVIGLLEGHQRDSIV